MNKILLFVSIIFAVLVQAQVTKTASAAPAEIVYDDFGGTPLTYSFGTAPLSTTPATLVELDLPGGKKVKIERFNYGGANYFQILSVDVKQNLVGSFYYAAAAEANETWSDVSSSSVGDWGNISSLNTFDYATEHLRSNPTYIPFRFTDTSDGNTVKYGYVNCSTELTGSGNACVLTLKIYSYAYKTDGSEIAMGNHADTSDPTLLYDTYPVNLGGSYDVSHRYEEMMGFWTGRRFATPFSYAGGEYVLTNITLYASRYSGSIGDLQVGVYSDSGGSPGELLLEMNNPASMDWTAADQVFTSSSQVVFSAGTIYWVIIEPSLTTECVFSVYPSQNSLNDVNISYLSMDDGLSWDSWMSENATIAMKVYGGPPPAVVQYELSASSGPQNGGNSVTITTTNSVFGNGSDISSVTVGGVAAGITEQTATSVTITLPSGSEGAKDIVIVSESVGTITLAGAYTFNPAGMINEAELRIGGPYISGGDWHSMALKADGSIAAWGYDYYGQLNVPLPNDNFIAVSAGAGFSMGLKADGTVTAWGRNFDGQATVPAPNSNFVAISAGDIHSLGVKVDGSVVGWGVNTLGQLDEPVPNSNFVAVAAGYSGYSLGLKDDGRIVGWGRNDYEQLNVPAPNSNFVDMAADTVMRWG